MESSAVANRSADGPGRTFLDYLLFPVTFPFLVVKHVIGYSMQLLGLKQRRTLEGKVVLITGASAGIGESLAKLFYLAGCRLILAARRKEELERVKNELVRLRTKEGAVVNVPAILVLDVGDLSSIADKCREALGIFGQVDILVNNAGITFRGSVEETEVNVHQKIMNVNYFGALALVRNLLPQMTARKSGHIAFVSSVAGKFAGPYRSAYAASKHALQAFSDSLRAEVAADGVQVTILSPGYVKTNLSLNALTSSGNAYGKIDQATIQGYTPEFVAASTFGAILNGDKDIVLAPFHMKYLIFLRNFLPSLFFARMAKSALTKG